MGARHNKGNKYSAHRTLQYLQPNCTQYTEKLQYRTPTLLVHVHAGMRDTNDNTTTTNNDNSHIGDMQLLLIRKRGT